MLVVPEAEVLRLAREISERAGQQKSSVFGGSKWMDRLVDWTLRDPDFKTQLFRFVDVLPACRSDDDVLRHLHEYLGNTHAPAIINTGIQVAEHAPLGAKVSALVARRNVMRMARQFIAGEDPKQAMEVLDRLWRMGEASTVDLLGEKTVAPADADYYAQRSMELLQELTSRAVSWPAAPILEEDPWGSIPRANLSLKPTALSPLFGPLTTEQGIKDVMSRLQPILEYARAHNATINLDMEHYEVKDLTIALLHRIGSEFPNGLQLGCVVQAYLKDAFADLERLAKWSTANLEVPLQIRLVKGAQWDAETIIARAEHWDPPVFEEKRYTDANYERCVRFMIEHAGEIRPAFASHNVRSLAYAMAAGDAADLPINAYELQLLYGMAAPVHAALGTMGRRVRVYAPIGELVPGMAYLVRRLLENTSNESFVRHRFVEGDELEQLVRSPGIADGQFSTLRVGNRRKQTNIDRLRKYVNEPALELRQESEREALEGGILRARRGIGFEAPVVIDGRDFPIGSPISSRNPSKADEVMCVSGAASAEQADDAVERAFQGWQSWRKTTWEQRAAILLRTAAIFRADRLDLAGLIALEVGKPPREADADVCEAIDFCEYYARMALHMGEGKPILDVPGESNTYSYQPRGVGVVIAPWNFPLAIATGMVSAALVTGNAVCFKPAEQSPGVAWKMFQAFREAGIPSNVLHFLPGWGEEVGAALVEHPKTAFVTFTGSRAVGLEIIQRASRTYDEQDHVKRIVAEMGGKNPIIVDRDADIDVAIPGIVQSAFGYAGQKCSAASRVICVSDDFDEFVQRLVGAVNVVPIGDAGELATVVGPVIDEDAYKRLHWYQKLASADGNVVVQRDDIPDSGYFIGPTVVVLENQDSAVWREEIFGPLLAVTHARDFEHALRLANDTEYALTGGLFSRTPSHLEQAGRELRAGNVYLNRGITGAMVGRQPFGGYGMSGVGSKAGGPDYLLQFVEPRVVTENTMRQGFAPEAK